jgi:uncharacterized protein YndB with AHSA1/START domain
VTTDQQTELRVTHRFDAPREEVFDAWIDPDVLRRWWAADPSWDSPLAEVDAREGGRYRLSMRDNQGGTTHTVVGEYKEIKRPERLAYTWEWEGGPEEMRGSEATHVVVEFREAGGGTEVVLTHSGFANGAIRDEHTKGWNAVLTNLERQVFS